MNYNLIEAIIYTPTRHDENSRAHSVILADYCWYVIRDNLHAYINTYGRRNKFLHKEVLKSKYFNWKKNNE